MQPRPLRRRLHGEQRRCSPSAAPSAPARRRPRSCGRARKSACCKARSVMQTGFNAGVRTTIKAVDAGVALGLLYPLPSPVAAGDLFTCLFRLRPYDRHMQSKVQQRPALPRLPVRAADRADPVSEADQRAAVVAEARSWIKTPWVHMAAIKGAGVDCAMLLARVYIGGRPGRGIRPAPLSARLVSAPLRRALPRHPVRPLTSGRKTGSGRRHDAADRALLLARGDRHQDRTLTILHSFQPVGCVVEEQTARNRLLKLDTALYASFWG